MINNGFVVYFELINVKSIFVNKNKTTANEIRKQILFPANGYTFSTLLKNDILSKTTKNNDTKNISLPCDTSLLNSSPHLLKMGLYNR